LIELIKKLTEIYGPSGREDKVRDFIENEVKDSGCETRTDYLGNLIVKKKGTNPEARPVMLAAHMDEIGMMITHFEKEGFLRFTNVGGISPFRLIGMRVQLPSGDHGVVFHDRIKDPKELTLEKMYIDIGAKDKEEAEKKAAIGDIAVAHAPLFEAGERIVSKALDDRIGCAVLLLALKQIKNNPHDLYFVFTSQEEVGIRGARTSAFGIDPAVGIAVDVTMTGDIPKAKKMSVSLGEGAAIKIKDNSLIASPQIRDTMIETAEKQGIKYQLEVLEMGGTDAGWINLTREGVLAGCISIPCRYVHSPAEMIDSKDVQAAVDLLTKLLEQEFDL